MSSHLGIIFWFCNFVLTEQQSIDTNELFPTKNISLQQDWITLIGNVWNLGCTTLNCLYISVTGTQHTLTSLNSEKSFNLKFVWMYDQKLDEYESRKGRQIPRQCHLFYSVITLTLLFDSLAVTLPLCYISTEVSVYNIEIVAKKKSIAMLNGERLGI